MYHPLNNTHTTITDVSSPPAGQPGQWTPLELREIAPWRLVSTVNWQWIGERRHLRGAEQLVCWPFVSGSTALVCSFCAVVQLALMTRERAVWCWIGWNETHLSTARQMCHAKRQMCHTYRTSDVSYRTSDVSYRKSGVSYRSSDVSYHVRYVIPRQMCHTPGQMCS